MHKGAPAKKRPRRSTEHQEQAALFEWAAMNEIREPWLRWLHAIPNGGKRDARTGARLKAEGVKAGVPDVFMPMTCKSPTFHGLYIEFKSKTGKMTQKQLEFAAHARNLGYGYVLCYSWLSAARVITNYLNHCGRHNIGMP
jgi:hypothetical protein